MLSEVRCAIDVSATDCWPSRLVIAPTTPETIYAGTPVGVFRRTADDASWVTASTGLTNADVAALVVAPSSSFGPQLIKTSDGGLSWVAASTGLGTSTVRAIAVDPETPATVYVAASTGCSRASTRA